MPEVTVSECRTHAFRYELLPNWWECGCGARITDEDMHARFPGEWSSPALTAP